jgi:hypothetical protein
LGQLFTKLCDQLYVRLMAPSKEFVNVLNEGVDLFGLFNN